MPLNPSKPVSQAQVKAGTILFEAGDTARMLCILHKGEVAYVNSHHGSEKQMITLGENATPGFGSLLRGEPYPCRIVTVKDSVISAFPVKTDSFTSMLMGKLNVGVMAVRSLFTEVNKARKAIQTLNQILSEIQSSIDNLSISFYKANPQMVQNAMDQQAESELLDSVLSDIASVWRDYSANGGAVPAPINKAWLLENHSGFLHKEYGHETEFKQNEFDFLKRLIALPMNIQGAMYKADVAILQGLAERLGEASETCLQEIVQIHHSIDEHLSVMIEGDYSLTEKFFLLADTLDSGTSQLTNVEFIDLVKFISERMTHFFDQYKNITGSSYEGSLASLQKLRDFLDSSPAAKQVETQLEIQEQITVNADYEGIKNELEDSPGKIMKFAGMSNEEIKKIKEDLKKLRAESNPLDSGGDPRKIRRQINPVYWKTWEQAYYKFLESQGNVPVPVRMMLSFGYFDEQFLEMEHLATLYNMMDTTRGKPEYPIVPATEWLKMVGDKKEPPSIDELGVSFFEKLKNEHKDLGWKRESDVPDEFDNFNSRVHYEINSFLDTNVRLTSGSPTTSFPVLNKYQIILPLQSCFVTYQKLSDAVDQLLRVDYSAFHREVLLNDEEAGILKEFIQTQVIPNFILVPSIGTKIMMWQDLSGRSKDSRGRIALPVFMTADLYTQLLDAIGAFRWELTKSIMGPDWNNVSNPSITADYTDYVQFFKKNRELSQEVKEKLASEFKRFRNDRDRFVNDYINWIKFEAEGTLKLNRVARAIFYRHVPFEKSIRDALAPQPAYADLHNRFTNIRRRKLKELEVRYRKYGEPELLPEKLKYNLDFYKV